MPTLTYKVIKNKTQYRDYCNTLEKLVFSGSINSNTKDEIELLTVLIEKWEAAHSSFSEIDPISLLRSLLNDHHMKPKDLADLLMISKGYVSDILNYKKGLSKEIIRALASHFKISQEALNKPYKLAVGSKQMMNT